MSSTQRATLHVHFPHYFQPVRLISLPHVSVKLPLEAKEVKHFPVVFSISLVAYVGQDHTGIGSVVD